MLLTDYWSRLDERSGAYAHGCRTTGTRLHTPHPQAGSAARRLVAFTRAPSHASFFRGLHRSAHSTPQPDVTLHIPLLKALRQNRQPSLLSSSHPSSRHRVLATAQQPSIPTIMPFNLLHICVSRSFLQMQASSLRSRLCNWRHIVKEARPKCQWH